MCLWELACEIPTIISGNLAKNLCLEYGKQWPIQFLQLLRSHPFSAHNFFRNLSNKLHINVEPVISHIVFNDIFLPNY